MRQISLEIRTMTKLQTITSAGYTVEVLWECQFDKDIQPPNPELKQHPIVQHVPLNTRDALYEGSTETTVLHYALREVQTIQYSDVMSLYNCVCKYFKFPKGHHKIHVETRVGLTSCVE